MSKVIFFNLPAHGHINPTLPLTKELIKRGEEIIYYSMDEFREKIEQTGATFRSYKDAFHYDYRKPPANILKLRTILLELTEKIISEHLEDIKKDNGNYIIHDSLCPWGKYMAKLLGIPAISSVSIFAFSDQELPSWNMLKEIIKMFFPAIPSLLKARKISKELNKTYNLKIENFIDTFINKENLNLVYTSKEFQPDSKSFDDSFKFVGPSILSRNEESDFPFEKLEGKRVIYISLGTIFNEDLAFYQNCFKAFGNMDVQVVLSIGKKIDISALKDIPVNFIVKDHVPQLEILKKSSLFITHGGMNSVHEGLYHNVPLIVIPQQAEQGLVAEQVKKTGAGIYLRNSPVTAEELRKGAEKIFSDESFRVNSIKIGESFKAAGGFLKAADEIFLFKERYRIG